MALRQPVEHRLHGRLLEREHRVAIGLLVAGVLQRIERQRVLIRGGHLLLEQPADDARLERIVQDIHGVSSPYTASASNTGPSTQTRFIAGPAGVRTGTVQPAQPPTAQAMNSSSATCAGTP